MFLAEELVEFAAAQAVQWALELHPIAVGRVAALQFGDGGALDLGRAAPVPLRPIGLPLQAAAGQDAHALRDLGGPEDLQHGLLPARHPARHLVRCAAVGGLQQPGEREDQGLAGDGSEGLQ